jgi:acyl dehydratase
MREGRLAGTNDGDSDARYLEFAHEAVDDRIDGRLAKLRKGPGGRCPQSRAGYARRQEMPAIQSCFTRHIRLPCHDWLARLRPGRNHSRKAAAMLSMPAKGDRDLIYFEDLKVGTETDFGHYDVTRDEVLEFARKYDPQPFHLSDEAAAQTHFGRLAASGWHTCAMTMACLVRHMADEPQAGLGSPGVDELRWLKPVYPGDRLHVRGRIVEMRPSRSKPDLGSFRSEIAVTNQDDAAVLRFTSIVLIRRRRPVN